MTQTIGIPMGASCSPFLANLMLFMYELEYFSKAIPSAARKKDAEVKAKRIQLMRELSMCTRYIDDIWNPLVEPKRFQNICAQIYPEWLPVGKPESTGEKVNYLDMTIWHDGTQWQSKLYDKKEELVIKGLKINKFPHIQSKITTRCKYGCITSQLHRYSQVCTKAKFVVAAATNL